MAFFASPKIATVVPHNLLSFVALTFGCLTFYLLWKCVYNLYFHPLHRYPGPLLARVTRLWYIWYFVRGQYHLATQRAHERYGDVVRVAPDELSYTAASAWKDIYGQRPGKEEMTKDPALYNNILSTNSLVSALPRERHAFLRKLLAHSFSATALREQESTVEFYCDLFVLKLTEACDGGAKPLDMVAWYGYLAFDVVSDLAFGESFGCLKTSSYHPWVSMIVQGIRGSVLKKPGAHYPFLKPVLDRFLVSQAMIEKRKYHQQMTAERLDKRLQQSDDRHDFLVKMVEPGSGVTRGELLANVSVLTNAGSETTATLLAAVTYLLSKNPEQGRKLRRELETAFQSGHQITCESTRHLPYLQACLEEALRLFPPVCISLPRRTPAGGDYISGAWVPEETTVGMTLWPTFRSAKNFRDPGLFIPERWMGDERYTDDVRTAFHPFSMGTRNCIGQSLAYSEARLALAKVVWHFDLELVEGSRDWKETLGSFFIWYKTPLMVKLSPATRR